MQSQHGLLPTPQYIPSSRHGQFQPATPQNTTLILRKIPSSLNTVDKMKQHFSKFGSIVDIQCHYDNFNDAALVQFSSNTEAFAAFKSPQPVFNNRFIRLYWLTSYLKQQQNQQQHQQASTQSAPQSPAVGEPSHKKPLKERLSFPGQGENVAEGLNKENLAKTVPASVTGSTVYTSQLSSETTKSDELIKKPVSAETPESVAMAKKIQDENKKKALLLKLEVQKKARELMEQQLNDQKILMTKLEQVKTVEEKTQILNLVKKLSEAIDKEREILKKKDDLDIDGDTKSHSPFGSTKSQKSLFVIPPVHQLKINNKRLNTTSFLKAGANKLVNKPAPKPAISQIASPSLYAYSRVSVDRRPKQLIFFGVENDEEKKNVISFIQIGPFKIESIEEKKDENNENRTSLLVNFVTRRDAEFAYSKCAKSLGKYFKNVTVSWYKASELEKNPEDGSKDEKQDEKNETDDQEVDDNELENENKENPNQDNSLINLLDDEKIENKSLELKQNEEQSEYNKSLENADVFESLFNDKE